MEPQTTDLAKALSPVLVVSNFFGLDFLSHRSPKISICHRLIIFGLLIGGLIIQLPNITFWVHEGNVKDLGSILQLFKISIAWLNYFVNYSVTAWNHRKIERLMTKVSNWRLKLEKKNQNEIFFKQLRRVVASVLLIFGFQFLAVYLTPPEAKSYFTAPIYIFVELISIVVISDFVAIVLLLKNYLICLNGKISHFQESVDQSNEYFTFKQSEEINFLRKSHFDICEINRQFVSAYHFQLLLSVIKCFIEVTFWLASLIAEGVQDQTVLDLLLGVLVGGFNLLIIMNICYSCQSAVEEQKKTVRRIFRVINCSKNPHIRAEFRTFSVQTFHQKLSYSVVGFFKLDLKLLQEIFSAITSYITIIYTFSTTRS